MNKRIIAIIGVATSFVLGPYLGSAIASPGSVSFMTYNVENLFDTKKDSQKADSTYLPLKLKKNQLVQYECKSLKKKKWRKLCFNLDWNQRVLNTKLSRIARVIRSVNSGRGPDLVVLQEVENAGVVEELRKKYLKSLGYRKVVTLESSDYRGIDVAILSRLPIVGKPMLIPIPFSGKLALKRDFREILRADFRLPDKKILTVFGVHLPAPFHPYTLRKDAIAKLNELVLRLPADRIAIAAGDFNITRLEEKKRKTLKTIASKQWSVSHFIGCKSCKGSSYYPPKKSWDFLDMILFSKNLSAPSGKPGWRVIPQSIQVIRGVKYQTTSRGKPIRFEVRKNKRIVGISDHLPVFARIAPGMGMTSQKQRNQVK